MTPDLPRKGARDATYKARRRDARTKAGPEDELPAAEVVGQGRGFGIKAPFEPAEAAQLQPRLAPQVTEHDDQERETPNQVAPRYRPEPEGEQYLRLTVRVDDGAFSIVDSHLVAGPLAQATTLQGGHAYEVAVDGRALHVGAIPDLGTFRSFADPQGTLEQHRHHSYRLTTYEFDARVALADLHGADPAAVAITLYRVKQPDGIGSTHAALDVRSFAKKREEQLREVGRVVGIPHFAVPDSLAANAPRTAARRPDVRKIRDPNTKPDDAAVD